jgi:uncharacterized protein (DUF1501 family)
MSTRRLFVKHTGLTMFGAAAAPLWLTRAVRAADASHKTLVVIFQRGAVDGLNMVVPYGDDNYAKLRPNIAIATPRRSDAAAIDLDGHFGLHPALAPLKAIYDAQSLAIVHAVGSPDNSRSHFDAQDSMESGTPGRKATQDGWLSRALAHDAERSPLRAVSLGTSLARTLRGSAHAVALRSVDSFAVRDKAIEELYRASSDLQLQTAGEEMFAAIRILEAVRKQAYKPAAGVQYPSNALGQSLRDIARLIKANVGLEAAFADMPGWDTHAAQPAQLQSLLTQFGAALAAFYRDIENHLDQVVVVTMSEFGRTAKENGARGTDHGHGNVMLAFGGGIRGGKVYGEWPGLKPDDLFEGRDLAATTDFRDVLGELVTRHLHGTNLSQVFPGYKPKFRKLIA